MSTDITTRIATITPALNDQLLFCGFKETRTAPGNPSSVTGFVSLYDKYGQIAAETALGIPNTSTLMYTEAARQLPDGTVIAASWTKAGASTDLHVVQLSSTLNAKLWGRSIGMDISEIIDIYVNGAGVYILTLDAVVKMTIGGAVQWVTQREQSYAGISFDTATSEVIVLSGHVGASSNANDEWFVTRLQASTGVPNSTTKLSFTSVMDTLPWMLRVNKVSDGWVLSGAVGNQTTIIKTDASMSTISWAKRFDGDLSICSSDGTNLFGFGRKTGAVPQIALIAAISPSTGSVVWQKSVGHNSGTLDVNPTNSTSFGVATPKTVTLAASLASTTPVFVTANSIEQGFVVSINNSPSLTCFDVTAPFYVVDTTYANATLSTASITQTTIPSTDIGYAVVPAA